MEIVGESRLNFRVGKGERERKAEREDFDALSHRAKFKQDILSKWFPTEEHPFTYHRRMSEKEECIITETREGILLEPTMEEPVAEHPETIPSIELPIPEEHTVEPPKVEEKEASPKQSKFSRRKEIQLLAETYVAEHGSKAVVKAIARGHIDTEIIQAIGRYAEQEGVKLRLRDTIGKTFHVTPMLRTLQTIQPDLHYSNDLLFYTAVQKQIYSTVEYLLMQGSDPLCRNGMCIVDAMGNRSLLHLLLDYLPNTTDNSRMPTQLIEDATNRNDNNLVRLLLIKGCKLTDAILDSWSQNENKEYVLLRLYVRYQPLFVMNYKNGKILKELVKGSVDQEMRREIFSFFVSKVGKELLSVVAVEDTEDEFVRFMIRDLQQGLYDGLKTIDMQGQSESSSKKRKSMEMKE